MTDIYMSGRKRPVIQLLPLAERALAQAYDTPLVLNSSRGVRVIIKVTAAVDTPSVVPVIMGYNRSRNEYYPILTGAAIAAATSANAPVVLTVFPGATNVNNLVANNSMPDEWIVRLTHGDTDSITYSVDAQDLD
jgi:hypothetical protein